jgi:hypothetical protein
MPIERWTPHDALSPQEQRPLKPSVEYEAARISRIHRR